MTTEDLACKIECHDLLVRLCQALDAGQNDAAADLFADDAVLLAPTGQEVTGAAIRAFLTARRKDVVTRHLLTNVLVTVGDPGEAEAVAYITVYRVIGGASDALPRRLPETPQASGDWRIGFRKTEAGWRISRYAAVSVFEAAVAIHQPAA